MNEELIYFRKIMKNFYDRVQWNITPTAYSRAYFHPTLLYYSPKQNSSSNDTYNIRNMLAVIVHNHHKERGVEIGQDGAPYNQAHVYKRTK